jgi:hypothetical protein
VFEWETHYEAENYLDDLLTQLAARSPAVATFAERLADATSTRMLDWVDHLAVTLDTQRLSTLGFARVDGVPGPALWRHPEAQLPAICEATELPVVALRVDDVGFAASVHGTLARVAGSVGSAHRSALIAADAVRLLAVERRSWRAGAVAEQTSVGAQAAAEQALALWRFRRRDAGIDRALDDARTIVELVGQDIAASLAMQAEREFWQARNTAARVQHSRQQMLGLGWGNHDHHTFRSSRENFVALLELLEILGFTRRERFHAGTQAGWGAQVLEQAGAGVVVFADVDLEPGEIDVDFDRPLGASDQFRTVGLWCALHGDSILQAGMHHLEGQFDFERLRDDLHTEHGIAHMPAFSDFEYLRQAFTEAELWPVAPARLAPLVAAGHLSAERGEAIARDGAPGSHLENLARRGGYKGFNKNNVSATMRRTDPRIYEART